MKNCQICGVPVTEEEHGICEDCYQNCEVPRKYEKDEVDKVNAKYASESNIYKEDKIELLTSSEGYETAMFSSDD